MAKMHVFSDYISAKLTAPEQALIEAVSPKVDVERKDNGYHVIITDIDGKHEFDLLNGERGLPGLNGFDGNDGETPLVMAVKKGTTTTVTFSTSKYQESFDIEDGKAGTPGQNGISPQATVTKTGNTVTIKITDLNGITMATVSDGAPGQPGADGVSPNVTVTDIAGGHRVTITDAAGVHSFDVLDGADGASSVADVQVNGVSVLSEGVANVPLATDNNFGVVKGNGDRGVSVANGVLRVSGASRNNEIKQGTNLYKPIIPFTQDMSTFYGLAKAAGDTTQSKSSNAVGAYTESAKSAISEMLNGSVTVSGTTPSINALPGVSYVCGEVATIDIVTPETGIVDIVFVSGSTPAVLTVTPPNGLAMKWANGFDTTSLEANTTYEINIKDGCLGVAGAWT